MNGIVKLFTSILRLSKKRKNLIKMTQNHLPQYQLENGLRLVEPYFQTIKTTVKTRWLRRTVLDVLSSEFRQFGASEYRERMKNHEISVVHRVKLTKKERKIKRENNILSKDNTKRIVFPELVSYQLCDNDVIERVEHVHERSVVGIPHDNIEVIHEDDEVLVVNKPSGIPIHPVQNYYFNSLVKILETEGWRGRNKEKIDYQLRPCYRLDKLTSGVCIFAKTSEAAKTIQLDIQNREVQKVYLARVNGEFPGHKEIECTDDIVVLDTKKGIKDGITRKSAKTIFQRVSYNKDLDQSIVKCYPKTGRTHQIRIHLRNLQFPIVNDPLYGHNQLMGNRETITEDYFNQVQQNAENKRITAESDNCCRECGTKLYVQTEAKDLVLYLHALSYHLKDSGGWCYETKWPIWSDL